jgi:hypothetical protein
MSAFEMRVPNSIMIVGLDGPDLGVGCFLTNDLGVILVVSSET